MKFKEWRAGDEAFLINLGWIILEPLDNPEFPLQFRDYAFTKEGKQWRDDRYPSLLDHNPFNPDDPKNSPEFKNDWPFMLRGKRLEVGMEIFVNSVSGVVKAKIQSLAITKSGFSAGVVHNDGTSSVAWPPVIIFPDELSVKKKVAKWAYIDEYEIVFIEQEMEEDEVWKNYGLSVKMVPGTEREVEE